MRVFVILIFVGGIDLAVEVSILIVIIFQTEGLKKEIQELRKVRAGFQALVLPEGIPPTSSDVIARLNEHLLNVLNQLHDKEAELERAQDALEKSQRKFAVIIHQQVSSRYCVMWYTIANYSHYPLFPGHSLPRVQ